MNEYRKRTVSDALPYDVGPLFCQCRSDSVGGEKNKRHSETPSSQ
jgi:hypothetical protein